MTRSVLCPECLRFSEPKTIKRPTTLTIRGESVTVDSQVAVCAACNQEIGLAEFDDDTFRAAYAVYRARHSLLQPDQIKAIRSKYGLGQKAFSRLLGWGKVTLARYESGSLQSDSHDQTLKLAEDPAHVARLLSMNRASLTDKQVRVLEERLTELSPAYENTLAQEESARYGVDDSNVRKLREMAVYFAGQRNTWRTKLNKLLFYADFLHIKRYGVAISGARYIHMQYGPVPADFYSLQAELVDDASLDERIASAGDCTGTVFVANRQADTDLFTKDELETMNYVAHFFDDWSAKRIMEYSHQEGGWLQTSDRETIGYHFAADLQLS